MVVLLAVSVHAAPSKWRMTPFQPTAQTSLLALPQTS